MDGPDRGAKKAALRNWLDYHGGWLVFGLVLLWLLGSSLIGSLKKPKPDVRVAYVGSETLTDSAAAAIQTALEQFCEDRNGDGQVLVEVVDYKIPSLFQPQLTGIMDYVEQASLAGDLEACESEIFLLEDAAAFQRQTLRLELPDGTLPAEDDESGESNAVRWSDCPVLTALDLNGGDSGLMVFDADRAFIANLEICLRGYDTQEKREEHRAAAGLMAAITAGAR